MKDDGFESMYTKDDQGFYVRNEKPELVKLTDERIEDNIRWLVNEASAQSAPSKPARSTQEN